jgi:hypothetical protein
MGNTIEKEVLDATKDFLVINKSNISLGACCRFTATGCKIKPLPLPAKMWLTGEVQEVRVETEVLQGALSTLFRGKGPIVQVTLQGAKLKIVNDIGSQTPGSWPDDASSSLETKFRFRVSLHRFSIDFASAGHTLQLGLGTLQASPDSDSASVTHGDIELHLDGKRIGVVAEGKFDTKQKLLGDLTIISLNSGASTKLHLNDIKLLALLDMLAALQKVAFETDALVANAAGKEVETLSSIRLGMKLAEVSVQFDMFEETVLQLRAPQVIVNFEHDEIASEFPALDVLHGGATRSVSSKVVALFPLRGGQGSLHHNFPKRDSCSTAPWGNVVEILLSNQDFHRHRSLLETSCQMFDMAPSRKRQREDLDAHDEPHKALRR